MSVSKGEDGRIHMHVSLDSGDPAQLQLAANFLSNLAALVEARERGFKIPPDDDDIVDALPADKPE